MNSHTAGKTEHVTLQQPVASEHAQAIATQHRYRRQLSAVIWIVLAWAAGTVVFEITAIGGEPKHVVIETDDKPVTLFFHDTTTNSSSGATTGRSE